MTARTLPFGDLATHRSAVGRCGSTFLDKGARRSPVGAMGPVVVPARGAWPSAFVATSDEELEQLTHCRAVLGDLIIKDEVESLACLRALEHIGGDLAIVSTRLQNLEGLESLSRIEGDLSIGDNPDLRGLAGLSHLGAVGRSLFVWANDALLDLCGLGGVEFVPRHLEIWGNKALVSLLGLEHLVSVGGDFSLGTFDFGNESLRSVAALCRLRSVGGDFNVSLNPSLARLDGTEQLMRVGRSLQIRGNDRLRHVRALCGLELVGGDLVVEHNLRLEDLEGLDALKELGGELIIGANPRLEQLDAVSAFHARRRATRRSLEREDTVPVRLPRD